MYTHLGLKNGENETKSLVSNCTGAYVTTDNLPNVQHKCQRSLPKKANALYRYVNTIQLFHFGCLNLKFPWYGLQAERLALQLGWWAPLQHQHHKVVSGSSIAQHFRYIVTVFFQSLLCLLLGVKFVPIHIYLQCGLFSTLRYYLHTLSWEEFGGLN